MPFSSPLLFVHSFSTFPPILFYNPFSCYFYKNFFLFYCLPMPFVFLSTFKRLNHFYFMITARISISHWLSTWLQSWHQPHSLGCYYFLPNFHATPTHFQTLHNSQNSSFRQLLWILDIFLWFFILSFLLIPVCFLSNSKISLTKRTKMVIFAANSRRWNRIAWEKN